MKSLRILLGLPLIGLVAFASITMASARGQVAPGHQVLICSGTTVTVVTLDAAGHPVKRRVVCPDYGLTLFSAVAAAATFPPPRMVSVTALPRPYLHILRGVRCAAPVRSRGPPPA